MLTWLLLNKRMWLFRKTYKIWVWVLIQVVRSLWDRVEILLVDPIEWTPSSEEHILRTVERLKKKGYKSIKLQY